MRVEEIWRYPVKSMVGSTVPTARLTMLGIAGDRHWALRSLERGGIRGAKVIGGIMLFSARFESRDDDPDAVVVTLPDGTTVASGDPDVDARISAALGHRVVLESLPVPPSAGGGPGDEGNSDEGQGDEAYLDHFRRGPRSGADPMEELRGVFGRDADEPLPDFSAFPAEVVEFESPPGTHYDCWPLMVMTTSALAALAGALPGSDVDIRRFRPSMVVSTEEPGHPEFAWTGRRARLGDGGAVVEFLKPCPRCVMTTRAVAGGISADRAVLRHIVRDLDQNLGVYARVIEPGDVNAGDEMEFLG